MNTGESDATRISSRAELQRILTTLAQRVGTLESQLAEERTRREELEDLIERHDQRYGLLLEDILALEDAIDQVHSPSVDTEPPENALPIMKLTWTYRVTPDSLQERERRSAVVWSHFFDVCSKTSTKYVLDSSKVGTILTGDEGSSPHRQTIRRVMEIVASLGEKYVELRTVDGRNALVVDRQGFDDCMEDFSQEGEPA